MRKKAKSIPVNTMANEFGTGIAIEKIAVNDLQTLDIVTLNGLKKAQQSHREDSPFIFLAAKGSCSH